MGLGATSRLTKKELLAERAELVQTVRALEQRLKLLDEEKEHLSERARHVEALHERVATSNERFELLARLSVEINSLNLDKIYEVCITKIPYLLNAHYSSLYLLEDGHMLHLKRHSHRRALEHVIDLSQRKESLMAKVVESRKVRVFADLDRVQNPSGEDIEPSRPHRERYATRSCIVAPLVAGDEVLGVLNLSDPIDGKPFTDGEDYGFVLQVARVLAGGIANCRQFQDLELRASTDSLTGLVNHQAYFDALGREVLRADRYGGDLAVVMIDVDRFKLINDNEGHLAGDRMLTEVARVVADNVRLVDTAARYGGDEFALILPQSDRGAASVVAERIRERVARHDVLYDGRTLSCHVSLGLTVHRKGCSASDLVREADQALYRAKHQGGDRLGIYEVPRQLEPGTPSDPADNRAG